MFLFLPWDSLRGLFLFDVELARAGVFLVAGQLVGLFVEEVQIGRWIECEMLLSSHNHIKILIVVYMKKEERREDPNQQWAEKN